MLWHSDKQTCETRPKSVHSSLQLIILMPGARNGKELPSFAFKGDNLASKTPSSHKTSPPPSVSSAAPSMRHRCWTQHSILPSNGIIATEFSSSMSCIIGSMYCLFNCWKMSIIGEVKHSYRSLTSWCTELLGNRQRTLARELSIISSKIPADYSQSWRTSWMIVLTR
jgi:hypothetical protein